MPGMPMAWQVQPIVAPGAQVVAPVAVLEVASVELVVVPLIPPLPVGSGVTVPPQATVSIIDAKQRRRGVRMRGNIHQRSALRRPDADGYSGSA